MTAVSFWKEGSFAEHVLWEITRACVDPKLRGIKATCIAGGSLVPRVEGGSGDEIMPVVTGDDLM